MRVALVAVGLSSIVAPKVCGAQRSGSAMERYCVRSRALYGCASALRAKTTLRVEGEGALLCGAVCGNVAPGSGSKIFEEFGTEVDCEVSRVSLRRELQNDALKLSSSQALKRSSSQALKL
eukprot:scaffold1755_cov247-Pinguiococcus_pyrenoidosus.AAC.6